MRRDEHARQGEPVDESPMGWLQRGDGSWWAVDEFGVTHPVTLGLETDEVDADVVAALAAIGQYVAIDVDPLHISYVDGAR
ncbi:hypothetical protein [Nocardia sp. NPDC050710]|uniref:hypothetical protein n=1 Tax=Nocardia sp. NPDC050710 TaxID=3157220 RepID=UPI0033FD32A6